MPQVSNQNNASKEVRPKESLLHKFKLQVVQKVSIVFPIPDVGHHFGLTEPSVLWFVFVPNRTSFVDVGKS